MSDINSVISKPVEPEISVYMHQKAREKGIPVTGSFELTSRCNFSCKMCYIHSQDCSKNKDKELPAEKWLEIGRQAADTGTIFLLLTGGEPMLRSDFCEIYTGLKKMGFYVSVNTNASLITDEIFEMFKKDPPARLNISLYGASDDTYERLCGGRYFTRVMNNIERALNQGIQVKLNFSVTPYNCCDMAAVYDIARKLKLQVKSSTYMYPTMRNNNKCGENPARFDSDKAAFWRVENEYCHIGKERFFQKAAQTAKCLSLPLPDPEKVTQGEKIKCRAGSSSYWVDWQGQMSFCGMIPTQGGGDILNDGFKNCWEFSRKAASEIRLPKKCVSCRYKMICNICAAVAYTETGSFDEAPEYVCRISEKTVEYIKEKCSALSEGEGEK